MDVNMPVLDGIEATKLHRFTELGDGPRLPILGLTADATPRHGSGASRPAWTAASPSRSSRRRCWTRSGRPCRPWRALREGGRPDGSPPVPPGTAARARRGGGAPAGQPRRRRVRAEVAADFLAEGAELLRLLSAAAAARDGTAFRRHAHALASISANIGAEGLSTLCKAAQRLGGAEFTVRGRGDADAIAAEFGRVRAALQDMRVA
jgi:two-component system sensor histidine kinase RpfC